MKKVMLIFFGLYASAICANNTLENLQQALTTLNDQLKNLTTHLSMFDPKKKITIVQKDNHYKIDDRNLYIVEEDITKMHNIVVIVNAANIMLPKNPGGVAGAIWQAAGPESLNKEIDTIKRTVLAKTGGILSTGQAIITSSFQLKKPNNPSYIIHTPGPNCNAGENINLLYDSYRNSLLLAKELQSIAFPPISIGIFACDKQKCAELSIDAIRDTIGQTKIQDVYLTMYGAPEYKKIVIQELNKLAQ